MCASPLYLTLLMGKETTVLKTLTLTCFRKVEQDTMHFTPGLNIIRGANEASKSTRIEALSYALFGSTALRNPLAETVTWGCKETELKVEVSLNIKGATHRFIRAKSGAEVYLNDKLHVTGQNEVSAYASSLVGADSKTSSKLMLATQNNLRGALSEGPTAAGAIIENLASLDIVERIIDKAQERLSLGSSAVLEERLKGLEAQDLSLPKKPNEKAYKAKVEALDADIARVAQEALTALAEYTAAEAAYNEEVGKRNLAETLRGDCAKVLAQIDARRIELDTAQFAATVEVEDPAQVEAQYKGAQEWDTRSKAYAKFKEIGTYSGTRMSRAEHTARLEKVKDAADTLQRRYTNAQADMKIALSKRLESDVCPTCGQATAHLHEIKAKKQAVESEIAGLSAAIAEMKEQDKANDNEMDLLKIAYLIPDKLVTDPAAKLTGYITIDMDVIPALVEWKGEIPGETGPDVEAYKRRLDEIKVKLNERAKAQGKVETLTHILAGLRAQMAELTTKEANLGLLKDEDFYAINNRFLAAMGARKEAALEALKIELSQVQDEYKQQMDAWERQNAVVQGVKTQIEQTRGDIETIQFNNGLVKKLRAARPLIANKVWGLVLSTVSVIFSQMRGEQSVVTKEKAGFMVNGRSVDSLSGSTLDILGVAVRAALIKTFIPHCPFLILDEPAQGCDTDRSASLLGYIASAGFPQTLLITHESSSETLANNLIQL